MVNKDLNVSAQTNRSDVLAGAVITPHTAFKDLLTALGLKSGDKRPCLTPKRINFIMEGRIPITDYMGCKVYDDGFALYENGLGRYSVIWLPYCISYIFHYDLTDVEKEYLKSNDPFTKEELDATAWPAIVAFFGENRITYNLINGHGKCNSADSGAEDDDASETDQYTDEENPAIGFTWEGDDAINVDPLDAYIRKETRERVLAALTSKQRIILTLRNKHGLSGKEVARMLHCAESTVSQHLKAAYRIAQKIIRED